MLKIIDGKQASDFEEAVVLACREAGIDDISSDIIGLFGTNAGAEGTDRIRRQAETLISSAIRNRYGGKAAWQAERWFVSVPKLHYEGKDTPQLVIEITVYLVAVVVVRTTRDSRWVTLVGAVGGKPEMLSIPVIFLHAFLEKDLARFTVVARDADYTQWEIPGTKPVRLPNDFVSELGEILRRQPLVNWLLEFGSQSRYVAPLVMGHLFALAFQNSTKPDPVGQQLMNVNDLVKALESLDFKPTEARDMVNRAAPRLRASMTLEEAIRITLQGQGEDEQ